MAENKKTPVKHPKSNLIVGNTLGQGFTSENQPPPEVKSLGWEKRREQRLLTKTIFEKLTEGKTLDEYVHTLMSLAKEGNAKAIDTINRGIEDQVDKSEVKHEGLDIKNITFK